MKWNMILGGVPLAGVCLLVAWMPLPQDRDEAPGSMGADSAAVRKRFEAFTTPGPHHEKLAVFVGEWDTTVRKWMDGPDNPPQVTRGTATCRWLMQDRWLITERSGTMLGAPATYITILGYDAMKKSYVFSKVESVSTTMLWAEGDFDSEGKALHMYGTMNEPLTDEHDRMLRYTTRLLGPDRFILEVHDLHIDPIDGKRVEIEYARRK